MSKLVHMVDLDHPDDQSLSNHHYFFLYLIVMIREMKVNMDDDKMILLVMMINYLNQFYVYYEILLIDLKKQVYVYFDIMQDWKKMILDNLATILKVVLEMMVSLLHQPFNRKII